MTKKHIYILKFSLCEWNYMQHFWLVLVVALQKLAVEIRVVERVEV
jgi:hypothetical protein